MTVIESDILSPDRSTLPSAPAYVPSDLAQWEAREVRAEFLKVGRQLLTDAGWQTVRGLIVFEDADQVSVFTDQRDDLMTDGWRFHFGDTVKTRLTPTAEAEYRQKLCERRAKRQARRLAKAAANCPEWCVEHYDGGDQKEQRNHSSEPLSVAGCNPWTGEPVELGLWLERRDDRETGEVETIGLLEVRLLTDDIELTPGNMRLLASKLMSLADRAVLHR